MITYHHFSLPFLTLCTVMPLLAENKEGESYGRKSLTSRVRWHKLQHQQHQLLKSWPSHLLSLNILQSSAKWKQDWSENRIIYKHEHTVVESLGRRRCWLSSTEGFSGWRLRVTLWWYIHNTTLFFLPVVPHMACRILVPQLGTEPVPPAVGVWRLN